MHMSSPTEGRIVSLDDLARSADRSFELRTFDHASETYDVAPAICTEEDRCFDNEEFQRQFIAPRSVSVPPRSLVVLRDCFVLPNAAIVTNSGAVIRESCFPYTGEWVTRFFSPWITDHPHDADRVLVKLTPLATIDEPTFYVREHGESGFFHWMHSVYPRLDVLRVAQLNLKTHLLYDTRSAFQREGLELLPFGRWPILPPSFEGVQFFRRLIFPSPLVDDGDFWLRPKSVCAFFDRLPRTQASPGSRIVIVRNTGSTRSLINERELIATLEPFGFKEVFLDDMSFTRQIELFQGADFVVAAHGAGLSHIASMAPGGKLLEILHPGRFWPTFRALAGRRGLHYGCVVGALVRNAGDSASPFSFSVERLLEVLTRMTATP